MNINTNNLNNLNKAQIKAIELFFKDLDSSDFASIRESEYGTALTWCVELDEYGEPENYRIVCGMQNGSWDTDIDMKDTDFEAIEAGDKCAFAYAKMVLLEHVIKNAEAIWAATEDAERNELMFRQEERKWA